jgi:hypothetical protein
MRACRRRGWSGSATERVEVVTPSVCSEAFDSTDRWFDATVRVKALLRKCQSRAGEEKNPPERGQYFLPEVSQPTPPPRQCARRRRTG